MNETTIDPSAITVGTEVAWLTWRGAYGPEPYTATVSRLTPTQIVCTSDRGFTYRFRRTDGWGIGGPMRGVYLRSPSDPEVIKARAVSRFRGAVRDIETLAHAIDLKNPGPAEDQLNKIIELVEQALLDLVLT